VRNILGKGTGGKIHGRKQQKNELDAPLRNNSFSKTRAKRKGPKRRETVQDLKNNRYGVSKAVYVWRL